MGTVYRAEDLQGNDLAVKVLKNEFASDPIIVTRFIQERSILLRLVSSNIVSVVDLVVEGETMAIVMERVRGGSLREYLQTRDEGLETFEAIQIAIQILDGLTVAHSQGVIHRDVKPDNILVDKTCDTPIAKITDFGISGLIEGSPHTRLTSLVGTPEYMAPELVKSEAATSAVDIYSTGIVLYEMIAGRTPFGGGNVYAVLKRHAENTPDRPHGIEDELWTTIQSMLAKRPAMRPNAADLRKRLSTIVSATDDTTVVRTRPDPIANPTESSTQLGLPNGTTPSDTDLSTQVRDESPTLLRTTKDSNLGSTAISRSAGSPRKRLRLVVGGLIVVLLIVGGGIAIAVDGGGPKPHKAHRTLSSNTSPTKPVGTTAPQSPWSTRDIDGSNGFNSISCTSETFCAALGTGVLTFDGSNWSEPTSIDGSGSGSGPMLSSISCTTTTFCMAVDSKGNSLTYDGSSWSAPTSIDGSSGLNSISCIGDAFCAAVDSGGNVVSYNGSKWSAPMSIDGSFQIYSISCTSQTFCAAVDNHGNVLTYNGSRWTAPTSIDGSDFLTSVSCTSATFCMAVDYNGDALTYNGSSWTAPASIGASKYLTVSCATDTFCMAVDFNGNAYSFNGSSWSAPITIGTSSLSSISCATNTACVAVDVNGNAHTYATS
jgi:serine/threonine protein kinase